MPPELAALLAFAVAGTATYVMVPLAIRVAGRLGILDHPGGYHQHSRPTPQLGGTAVIAGLVLAALVVGAATGTLTLRFSAPHRLFVLLVCAVGLWLLGTLDDRFSVAPGWRLMAEAAVAVALVWAGPAWRTYGGSGPSIALTVLWVVGLVNAFNLMDNLDGACATVAAVSAAGIGTLSALTGDTTVAALAFALAGACVAFLRFNLASPSRIFLGDGGSMPIGLLVAGLAMAASRQVHPGNAGLLGGAMLAGLVILDTALVTVSRTRRRVPLLTGGRDHLSHRLLLTLRSPRRVAVALAVSQAVLCALAIVGERSSTPVLVILALAAVSLGALAIAVLETLWRPAARASVPVSPAASSTRR